MSIGGALSSVDLGIVSSFEDAEKFMGWLGERRSVLAVDTETAGLSPWDADARIRLIQFGDRQTGWAIPFEWWGGLAFEAMTRYEGPIVMHNSAFDTKYMAVEAPRLKIPYDRLDDTMIMARLIDSTGSAALKTMSNKLIDSSSSALQGALDDAMKKNGWTFNTVPIDYDAYVMYGAMDTVLTARLWEILEPQTRGNLREVYELEMAARRVCTQMEIRGFRVDVDYCKQKEYELREYVEKMIVYCQDQYGISPGSTMQLAQWLIDHAALDPERPGTKFTPAGRLAVDKEVLKLLAEEGWEIATDVLRTRKADKLAGTYFANFVRFARDGILHPNVNTLAARTGRMSVTEPALQTLSKTERVVRDAFLAYPHDDHVLLSCDYSQVEMRLIAHFSGDTTLIEAFEETDRTGGDFFTNIGKQIYGPDFTKADRRRGYVKNVMYASGYGAGIPKMALTAGVPESIMRPIAEAVFATYPGIKGLQLRLVNEMMTRNKAEGELYIRTPMNRKLKVERGREYTATNYTIQGHAAEILKQALVDLDSAGLGEYMVLPVHDEVLFSVPRGIADDVKPIIEECMTVTRDRGYRLQLPAQPTGPYDRWGEAIGDK